MSIEKVYVVYDSVAEYYLAPFCLRTNNEAVRWFTDCVNAFDNRFYSHPAHYTLFEIGSFDNSNAVLDFSMVKKSLVTGNECVSEDLRQEYVKAYNARVGISNAQ